MKAAAVIGILGLLIILAISRIEIQNERNLSVSYWLWAGVTAQAAPPNSELYVYQGLIFDRDGIATYQRIGLYPHPLQAKKIFLVYRLEGDLPDPNMVISVFYNNVTQWQHHPLTIAGLQLDFDSPTSKLLIYSNFLKKLRDQLPRKYVLSVTGLGDWAMEANMQAMQTITRATNEIVFQLYQGWNPLLDINHYVKLLSSYPLPFRIGLLANSSNNQYISILSKNPNFHGVIYFIRKKL